MYGEHCLSLQALPLVWPSKTASFGGSFPDDDAVERAVCAWFRQQPQDFYAAGLQGLVKRWDKFLNLYGDYVENKCCLYVIMPIRFFSITICNLLIDFPSYNQQDASFSRSTYFYKLLYMFQAVPPPIIRSTKLFIQRQVLPNQYCCLLNSFVLLMMGGGTA